MTTHLGIAVIGLNGSGKSTLAHALAKELDLYEMDVEDYYFPDQKSSRAASLDGSVHVSAQTSDTLPFSSPRSKMRFLRLFSPIYQSTIVLSLPASR